MESGVGRGSRRALTPDRRAVTSHPPPALGPPDGRRTARPYAPGTLVPGPDSSASALLGRPGLRDPAALRHGGRRGDVSSGDHIAGARAEALERGLRAALAAAEGWPLRREPEPATALLPVSGDPEAVAA